MQTEHRCGVRQVTEWEHAGVAYYIHVGSDPQTTGHLTIMALGYWVGSYVAKEWKGTKFR